MGWLAAAAEASAEVAGAPSLTLFEIFMIFIGAVALFAVTRLVRWVFPLVPLRREQRELLGRLGPLAEVVIWLGYLVSVIVWVLTGDPIIRLVALVGLATALIVAAWSFIRDYLTGVLLRTEGTLALGDVVRVGDVEGTVRRLRARAAELDLPDGDRVVIPYRSLGDNAVVRRIARRVTVRHTFALDLPAGIGVEQARDRVRRAALLCHWVPPRHEPKFLAREGRTLEVTVYTLSDLRAADVEAVLREALE